MKGTKASFVGSRPIFTGSPTIVPGGFNLDKASQNFRVGDVIPAGTLAIYDEQKRTVKVVKTAKVLSVKGTTVTLYVDEFYEPIFCEGDRVAKAGAISFQFHKGTIKPSSQHSVIDNITSFNSIKVQLSQTSKTLPLYSNSLSIP